MAELAGEAEIPLTQISIAQGLSQGMINALVEDSEGYIWLGTKDGLNRFDGKRFKTFRHSDEDSLSIADNFISSLAVDAKGRLWVGTQSHGLDLYDPSTESFIHFRQRSNELTSDFIGVLAIDPRGDVLVQTLDDAGYNVISSRSDGYIKSSFTVRPILEVYPALSVVVHSEWTKHIGFTADGTLWYFDRQSIVELDAKAQANGTAPRLHPFKSINSGEFFDNGVLIFDHGSKNLYVTRSASVLDKYDRRSHSFQPYIQLPKGHTFIKQQFIDRDNWLWSFTETNDLLQLDLDCRTLRVIRPLWNLLEPNAQNHTFITLQDKRGNLWMGTGGNGFLKISAHADRFKRVSDKALYKDERISMFRVSTSRGQALHDVGIRQQWLAVSDMLNARHPNIDFSQNYTHLTMDNDGQFWMGASSQTNDKELLFRIDPKTQTVTEKASIPSSYRDTWFGHPTFMTADGSVWFSEKVDEGNTGLYHYTIPTGKLTRYDFPCPTRKFQYRFVSDWYEDAKQKLLWLATTHGLFSFHTETKKWNHYAHRSDDTTSIAADMLLSVCPDPTDPNVLWVGTEGSGLDRFDVRSGRFKHHTTKQGFPNNVIYAIQSDAHSNLWISTNQGLCLFDPRTGHIRVFNQSDGLPGNEFNRYEYSRDADGHLYFGGTSGLVHFNPLDFYSAAQPCKVIINELRVINEPVLYTHGTSRLPKPIEHCKHLTFSPEEQMITFGFCMLDHTNPAKHRFKYMLEGFDEDWIDARTTSEATYTNLAPGNYVFKVIGCNSDDVWSTEPTSIAITVLPPWYATWWFRILIMLVVIGFLYALYRYRLFKALEMERIRNRIAQDLHDEIGSTLSSISLYGAVMQRSADKFPQNINDILGKIIDSTSEMMESMNDMVWTIKADNDNFEHVVYRMRAFAGKMCEAKGIVLLFKADPKVEKLELGMERRKNIYLIFKEAVNNAVKYSDCDLLSIAIRQEDDQLMVYIKDDGIGFDPAHINGKNDLLGGNGLRGMQTRAKEMNAELTIDSQPGAGCIITLKLQL